MDKKKKAQLSVWHKTRRLLLIACFFILLAGLMYLGVSVYQQPQVQRFVDNIKQSNGDSTPISKPSKIIAFVCGYPARSGVELYTISPDGDNLTLIGNRSKSYFNLDWSPDGLWIGLEIPEIYNPFGDALASEIYAMRFDGEVSRRLTYNHHRDDNPKWLSDSESILYTSLGDLYRISIDNKDQEKLSDLIVTKFDVFSDSSNLIIVSGSSTVAPSNIYMIDGDGTNPRLLKDVGLSIRRIELSPDDEQLIYQVNTSDLHIIDIQTLEQAVSIEMEYIVDFEWSPDGKWVAIVGREESTGNSLYLLDASTGKVKKVMDDVYPTVSWSPDNVWIAFTLKSQNSQLFKAKPDGSELQQLTDLDCNVGQISWSPN